MHPLLPQQGLLSTEIHLRPSQGPLRSYGAAVARQPPNQHLAAIIYFTHPKAPPPLSVLGTILDALGKRVGDQATEDNTRAETSNTAGFSHTIPLPPEAAGDNCEIVSLPGRAWLRPV